MNDFGEVLLTPEGYAKLIEEHRRLTTADAESSTSSRSRSNCSSGA
jgi:hypothetical protein